MKVRASHILVETQDLAQNLADRVAAGESFDTLAIDNSKCPSGQRGGDLGEFGPGQMVKPFEDAAFKLKPGEISDVVESDFGFHIIKLTDIKTASAGNFQQLRPQLEADLKKEQARKKYAELAEQFSNLVYEQSDGFDAVVQKLKLPVQNAKGITREVNGGGKVIWANPNLLKSIFSQESISRKRNTEAVETAANQLV
jgi:peptidyl-prolyl cis-trans isomerase D